MILESKNKCFRLPKKTTITLKGEVYTHIKGMLWSSHQMCSVKKVFVEISQNSLENTCAKVSFFNKVAGLRSATLLKKDSGTGVFLWILNCLSITFFLFHFSIFNLVFCYRVIFRSSCLQMFFKVFFKISQNPQEQPYVGLSHFNKVAGLNICNFIKKRLRNRCFPVNFTKFSRTAFLQNTFGRLLCM